MRLTIKEAIRELSGYEGAIIYPSEKRDAAIRIAINTMKTKADAKRHCEDCKYLIKRMYGNKGGLSGTCKFRSSEYKTTYRAGRSAACRFFEEK